MHMDLILILISVVMILIQEFELIRTIWRHKTSQGGDDYKIGFSFVPIVFYWNYKQYGI